MDNITNIEDWFLSSIVNKKDYINESDWKKLQNFIEDKDTSFLVLFKDRVKNNYDILKSWYEDSRVFYAVKACPNPEILKILIEAWSCFDIASIYELDLVLSLWATPDRVSFWNTIKKERDIEYAYNKWVRMFATDSEEDLEKISRVAFWSKVYFRLLTPAFWADWPLSRKFWCESEMAYELAIKARDLWLIPYWISFHVWSQQNDLYAWNSAIWKAKELFSKLQEVWIKLEMLNLWWWLPSQYIKKTKAVEDYLKEIKLFLYNHFWDDIPSIIMEPWRSLVWDIWVIVSEVVLTSKKSYKWDEIKWVYLDIWKFSGLIETLDEAIKYPIYTEVKWSVSPVILAGPTCDSMDILYENYKYVMPDKLTSWDKVYIFSTGAYTQSYSAIEFNWFPPLKVYVI
jgi:ornithine decarboxylase